MEEAKRLLDRLHSDNQLARRDTEQLRADLKRSDRTRRWVLAVAIIVTLLIGYAVYRGREFRTCMVHWAANVTDRSASLKGPGNARINLFFKAYTEAAGSHHKPLTGPQRSVLILGLDHQRVTYTVLPSHAKLEQDTDAQLLAYRDLIAALHANDAYLRQSRMHPVPTAPTCGGLF